MARLADTVVRWVRRIFSGSGPDPMDHAASTEEWWVERSGEDAAQAFEFFGAGEHDWESFEAK